MKHLVWGIISLLLGAYLLIAALLIPKTATPSSLIIGTVFVLHGIYRFNLYFQTKKYKSKQ